MSTPPLAAYVHREAPLLFAGRRLTFATSLDLFSSHQVDAGTRMLLRTLEPLLSEGGGVSPPDGPIEGARVLDLGCGYGPLGVALATLPAVAAAHLVDRDALALEFARENARRNLAPQCLDDRVTVGASLGLDDVRDAGNGGYDLVVSNVPGRAGDAVIASLLVGALGVLRPGGPFRGGLVAIVVIEPIRDLVAATLAREGIEVTLRRDTADYGVFHYRPAAGVSFPSPADGFAAGVYDAATLTFEDGRGAPLAIATVHGLPGHDRLDAVQGALMRRLRDEPPLPPGARVLVSNAGQGALAAYLLRAQPAAHLTLVDRDLLALRTARRALLALGCDADRIETRHVGANAPSASSDGHADLVAGVLHEGGGAAAVEAEYAGLVGAIARGGRALLAGSSTAITRLLAHPLPAGAQASRTRHRGTSILEVTRA